MTKRFKCFSRQIGAILVKDNTIVSTGYNGPSRGIMHCNERYKYDVELLKYMKENNIDRPYDYMCCPRQHLKFKSGQGLEWCIAGHAERNTLINAARNGIATKGLKMYMTCGVPCKDCMIEIINAGIGELIVSEIYFYDKMSKFLLQESNIKIREFDV